ncbi:MAG: glycosyltransferase family 2 protein [Desulfamplus sp.]|nr:glycosyltransferase family 2 protein [Desulfamplus sp.]
MLISILLVSHNNQKDLELLLPSLRLSLGQIHQQFGEINSEILLVDNCSSDSTVDFIQKKFSDVVLTKNKTQMGYGANQNQNIKRAKGKFILLMNPDMVVPLNLFSTMINFMESNHDTAVATCKICNSDGSCQYLNKREPAIIDLFVRRFFPKIRQIPSKRVPHILQKIQNIIRQRLDLYEMRDVGYDKVVDVPFISGSFMFSRASAIKEHNGFDERFFMYFEDVDLCRRLRAKYRLLYCPYVSVIHRWERASHKTLKWTLIFALSALQYFSKWGFKFF